MMYTYLAHSSGLCIRRYFASWPPALEGTNGRSDIPYTDSLHPAGLAVALEEDFLSNGYETLREITTKVFVRS